MPKTLVNPLDEAERPQRSPAPRLETLEGQSIALGPEKRLVMCAP